MQLFIRKYFVSICLIVSALTNVVAQEKSYSFTWLDALEKPMAGSLSINLIPQTGEGLYELDLSVTWLDQNGKPIIGVNEMPYLYLSKWDFNLPEQHLKCTTFEPKKSNDLEFQSSGKLDLQVLNGFEGVVEISAYFRYALRPEKIASGKLEKIDLKGSNELKLIFRVQSKNKANVKDISNDSRQKNNSVNGQAMAIRTLSDNYHKIQAKVKDFQDHKSGNETDRPGYQQDLEALSISIGREKALLNPDSLPVDTIQMYRDRYDEMNGSVLTLLSDYLKYQISRSGMESPSERLAHQRTDDSLRNLVRIRVEPLIQSQVDSLNRLAQNQKSIALQITGLLTEAKRHPVDNKKIDSLMHSHGLIEREFINLKLNHDQLWDGYRIDINRFSPITEIVNFHEAFQQGQSGLQSAIDQVDSDVAAMRPALVDTPWYLSNRLLWTGLLAVILLVFASSIWSSTRNKKILKKQLTILEEGNPGNRQGKSMASGIFTNEVPHEYFTVHYESVMPESMVGTVHYHTSSIKSVYQLVHGALQEKKDRDFGGYLFGNQYKLPGKGMARSELFIEKACHSKYLRSTISNDITSRADLVDELDELVRQNKKYRLIGWFTSIADNSMEIPEGLMKIHRSFFKEKWQIGILLNPGSEVLQGACFLRSKSGYLDPMPDPAAFVKWDEFYRYALNPSNSFKNDPATPDKKGKDYSRIVLNNTWGDSVVTTVNFDLAVLGEIISTAANQAIPKDDFQVVGYLYGSVTTLPAMEGKVNEYEVFVDRFIELSNEMTPRDLPGLSLIGWWGQAHVDVMNYLQTAVDYHEHIFQDTYQISCLANPTSGELRIFTRKHSHEMNNSTIETEEYSIKSLLSR